MPLYDFDCEKCQVRVDNVFAKSDEEVVHEPCGNPMTKAPMAPKNYSIRGDNSASTSPRGQNGS